MFIDVSGAAPRCSPRIPQPVSEIPDRAAGAAPAGSSRGAPNNALTANHSNKELPCHSR